MGNNPAGASKPLYEDFQPRCQWHREEGQEVLCINLQGFEREQLHVKTEKGSIVIWGERPTEPPKRQRFRKEINLSKDWKEDEIRAQFSATGILSIIIPKKETLGRQMRNSFSRMIFNLSKSFPTLKPKLGLLILVLNLLMLLIAIGVYVIQKYKHPYVIDN